MYRKDRSGLTSKKKIGGGVLTAVLKNTDSKVILSEKCESREELWVLANLNVKKLVIGTVYIAPDFDTSVYEEHSELVHHVVTNFKDAVTCIVGDYNRPDLQWLLNCESGFLIPH